MTTHPENTAAFIASLEAHRVQQETLQTELSQTHQRGGRSHPTALDSELRRFTRFVNDQQESLESSVKRLFVRAHAMATKRWNNDAAELKWATRNAVENCIALQEFVTRNREVLWNHAMTADETLGHSKRYSSLVHEIMPNVHLNSSLVCVVSDLFHAIRQAEETNKNNASDETQLWQAPSSFQRSTTKYWVKDENLTKLMMVCAMEAPLLVYGTKGPLTSTQSRHVNVSDGDKLWDSLATRITSIYFDSDDMSLYRERLKRAEGAQLLRARWYGTKMPTGKKIIFVELKTHHEKWVANKSVKERASIQEGDMPDFLQPVRWKREEAERMILRAKPKIKEDELEKATDLLLRMHNLVVNHKLSACVRSVYDRAAFQSSKSNDVRLTLDRNVTLVNERVQRTRMGCWCLGDTEAQTARSTVVPFNVFEVKLAGNDPMPTGLTDAQKDGTIEVATKFSKFLTGAAAFNSVPTLPYWAAHPAFYSFFEMDKRGYSNHQQGDYIMMDSSNEMVPGNHKVSIAPKNPARIEPKTYFANERTFVQWISASILLLSVASFLLQVGNFDSTVTVITFSALVLIVFATHLYFKRLNLLKDRQPHGYFNKITPIFLTVVVGMSILLVAADSIKGSDFVNLFSGSESRGRRMLRLGLTRRALRYEHVQCGPGFVGTNLSIAANPSSFVVDLERQSYLVASGDSIVRQPMSVGDAKAPGADTLIRVPHSHLQGLAFVDGRLFAVSGGPERTELIEMAWWGTIDRSERLRVVGRWTLDERQGQIGGFSFVPRADSTSLGSFYLHLDSAVVVYSIPARCDDENQYRVRPMRLNSLNMKALTRGLAIYDEDNFTTLTTFEGVTYILNFMNSALEAWNVYEGTLITEIELPSIGTHDNHAVNLKGFALERRVGHVGADATTTTTSPLFFHLLVDRTPYGGQIWSFPAFENTETSIFSLPDCEQVSKSSKN